MQTLAAIRDVQRATGRGLSVFLRDVGHGALELGHNTLALVGLATVAAAIFAVGRPDLRHEAEWEAVVFPLGASVGPDSILAVDYVLFGLFTASIYSLFMQITDPRLGATQFSTFMGGINLCSVWSAWAVGRLAASWGYPSALTTLALASTAALPLLYAIRASRSQSTDP